MRPTLMLLLAGTAWATSSTVETQVVEIRGAWARTQAMLDAGQLERATMAVAAGQNPTELELIYQGGSEADFERDPYAELLVLHRIVQRKVLPAVGEASATFQYDGAGQLVFAYTTGTDISGATGLDFTPLDELRVYFHEGEPFELLWDHAGAEPPRQTFIFREDTSPEAQAAQRAGRALYARGTALAGAVRTLVISGS